MEPPVCHEYLSKCVPPKSVINPSAESLSILPDLVVLTDTKALPILLNIAAVRDSDSDLLNPAFTPAIKVHVVPSVYKTGCGFSSQSGPDVKSVDKLSFMKWCHHSLKRVTVFNPSMDYCQSAYVQALGASLSTQNVLLTTEQFIAGFNGLGILTLLGSVPDCERVTFGAAINIPIPTVVGVEVTGDVRNYVVSTDIVLHFIKLIKPLSDCIVEVWGKSMNQMSISDRITISNMAKETSIKAIFFPCDATCVRFLKCLSMLDGKKVKMSKPPVDVSIRRSYDKVITFDLSNVETAISGPKRSSDRILVNNLKTEFCNSIYRKFSPTSFGLTQKTSDMSEQHGTVVGVSLAGCTNSSNAFVTLHAGMVAKNLIAQGVKLPSIIKGTFNSGGGLAKLYVNQAGLADSLTEIGLKVVSTCCSEPPIGNEGTHFPQNTITCGLLSGNGNFENRKFTAAKANFLMSSPLALILACAGKIDVSLDSGEIEMASGKVLNIEDVWPSREELIRVECTDVLPKVCAKVYEDLCKFCKVFEAVPCVSEPTFSWNPSSLYIRRPPYLELEPVSGDIVEARVLLSLGDNVPSEMISPAGSMSRTSAAANYLTDNGVSVRDFDSYGNRRGNHQIMTMGIFNNMKLVNKLVSMKGPYTRHFPTNTTVNIYDAAMAYQSDGTQCLILAGKNYGCGPTRDSGARGVRLLGVSAVVAESFDAHHRTELINQGVMPVVCVDQSGIDTTGRISISWPHGVYHGCKGVLSWVSSGDASRKIIGEIKSDVTGSTEVYMDVECIDDLEILRHGGLIQKQVKEIATNAGNQPRDFPIANQNAGCVPCDMPPPLCWVPVVQYVPVEMYYNQPHSAYTFLPNNGF